MNNQSLPADKYAQGLGNPTIYQRKQPTLFIIDESSFLSNQQVHDFLQSIDSLSSRVILVGDRQQIPAINAGKPSTILEQSGINTIQLNNITRQQNTTLLSAVKSAYHNNVRGCFHLLDAHMVDDAQLQKSTELKKLVQSIRLQLTKAVDEQPTPLEMRLAAVYQEYFSTVDTAQQTPLLMTLTNANRRMLNQWIRLGWQARGQLSGEPVQASVLEPWHLTEVEKSQISHFQVGLWVRLNLTGDYWQIKKIDHQKNYLQLSNADKKIMVWQPTEYREGRSSGIEVYQHTARALAIGEQLRWTRSDKRQERVGGEVIKVQAIDGNCITVVTEHNQSHTLDITQPSDQHWDYAYAVTTYFAQGKTDLRPIALIESHQLQLANQSNFLVMISRAVQNLTIVTNDRHQLLAQVLRHSGEKRSALEALGQLDTQDQFIHRQQKNKTNLLINKTNSLEDSQSIRVNKEQKTSQQLTQDTGYSPKISKSVYWQYDFLSQKLINNITNVLDQLLGKPKRQHANQVHYGRHQGSLVVTIAGDKTGWWKDFQTDEGGRSLVSLIQRETGLGFKETLDYAAKLLTLTKQDQMAQLAPVASQSGPRLTQEKTLGWTTHQKKMIALARAIARGTQPIANSVVERYLRETRGIQGTLPNSIRYHPKLYIKLHIPFQTAH